MIPIQYAKRYFPHDSPITRNHFESHNIPQTRNSIKSNSLLFVHYCHHIKFYGMFWQIFSALAPHPWRVSSFNCTVCINLLPFIADTHSPDVNELPDNENSIGDTHAAKNRVCEKIGKIIAKKSPLQRYFKHLLSLDIAAVSFINFIASAVQAFLFSVRILCCINYAIAVELLNQLMRENSRNLHKKWVRIYRGGFKPCEFQTWISRQR